MPKSKCCEAEVKRVRKYERNIGHYNSLRCASCNKKCETVEDFIEEVEGEVFPDPEPETPPAPIVPEEPIEETAAVVAVPEIEPELPAIQKVVAPKVTKTKNKKNESNQPGAAPASAGN